ncbi:hypothetical protein RFI_25058 [Reticulomyxa filosa]|uniref:Uncharacterized protein n=1 Tax=Reticulomyxa filosa TaxID=46433 RepID=X6MEJ0_RETFI|nr:hypothetical protein RFI_25058 [Reticulomyxa filosa]|eukprot:ETO12319.1 hypothetical protein RFI_25058 [Reticulomyxa filosa]
MPKIKFKLVNQKIGKQAKKRFKKVRKNQKQKGNWSVHLAPRKANKKTEKGSKKITKQACPHLRQTDPKEKRTDEDNSKVKKQSDCEAIPKERTELRKIEEQRKSFIGTFVRIGFKKRNQTRKYKIQSRKTPPKTFVLLKNVYLVQRNARDKNEFEILKPKQLMADHLWFNLTKGFAALKLRMGDNVVFDARVKTYVKGSKKRGIPVRTDYRLSFPTKLVKVCRNSN